MNENISCGDIIVKEKHTSSLFAQQMPKHVLWYISNAKNSVMYTSKVQWLENVCTMYVAINWASFNNYVCLKGKWGRPNSQLIYIYIHQILLDQTKEQIYTYITIGSDPIIKLYICMKYNCVRPNGIWHNQI